MPEETRQHCRHIHPSGHRCGSPTLRHEPFCYFHHAARSPIPQSEIDRRRGHQSTFPLPSLEDHSGIQLALTEIIARIANHDLDPRRAGLLLYALQIATCNLPKAIAQPQETIEDLTYDETYGPLAPEQPYQSSPKEKTLEQILLEQWQKDEEQAAAQALLDQAEEDAESTHLLTLQACTEQADSSQLPSLQLENQALNPTSSRPDPSYPRSRLSPRSTPNSHVFKILQQITGGHPRQKAPIQKDQGFLPATYDLQHKTQSTAQHSDQEPHPAAARRAAFPSPRASSGELLRAWRPSR